MARTKTQVLPHGLPRAKRPNDTGNCMLNRLRLSSGRCARSTVCHLFTLVQSKPDFFLIAVQRDQRPSTS